MDVRCIRLNLVVGCVWLARDLRGLAKCPWVYTYMYVLDM